MVYPHNFHNGYRYFSLGVLAVRGEILKLGFFVLSFLGVVLFSVYIFSILKEINDLKQIKDKINR